jgi:hypothetical protein
MSAAVSARRKHLSPAMQLTDVGQLLKISLLVSVIGSAALYFYAQAMKPRQASIAAIGVLGEGVLVRVAGVVERAELREKQFIFRLCDVACVNVHSQRDLMELILDGDRLVATGIIREYYGSTYIEAKKIQAANRSDGVNAG